MAWWLSSIAIIKEWYGQRDIRKLDTGWFAQWRPASTTELSMESHSFINKPIIEDMFLVLVEPPLEVVIDIPLRNHETPKIGALFGIQLHFTVA